MSCCGHCRDAGDFFNERTARKEMKKYKRRGPEKSTRLLIESIRKFDLQGKTLLDIGGGIGAIPFELFKSGISNSVNVDASKAYQAVSKKEATEMGVNDKSEYHFGDFTELAPSLQKADIVTLDKVICCYPDKEKMLSSSLKKTTSVYGVIFPHVNMFTQIGFKLINLWFRIRGSEFRTYLHSPEEIDKIIRSHDFELHSRDKTILWKVCVYHSKN